jgi:predicted nucleotidyltransferase
MSNNNQLPLQVEQSIEAFVTAAKSAFEADLVSIVMFGSAAEGKLRATSDVNVLLVLKRFDQANADRLREPMRLAHATVQMNAMFLLESEVNAAMEAFAVKFADIAARHRILFGNDPFVKLDPPRDAVVRRLKQVLLNLQLRLRERYVLLSLREEQLALVIADAAGPLRASAASLLHLEGQTANSPKEALEQVVREINDVALTAALQEISAAREERQLEAGKASPTLIGLIALTQRLRERVERLQ